VAGRAHGLRKAGAATAAENGATTQQLMAIFGWLTLKEAERYRRAAQGSECARRDGHVGEGEGRTKVSNAGAAERRVRQFRPKNPYRSTPAPWDGGPGRTAKSLSSQ
jgi:hypothetical protein